MAGYEDGGWLHKLKFRLTYSPIIVYLKHMRYCAYYSNSGGVISRIRFLYHFLRYKRLGIKLGFSIGYDVFGYGLHIPHYGTIVVNGDCKIGNYAVLHTSVCIGGAGKVVGDGIYVGTGAKVMGPIHLGDGVSIASQSLVNKNFTENHVLLAGMPASIKKNRKIWYEEDGGIYIERVKRIELLKKQMLHE